VSDELPADGQAREGGHGSRQDRHRQPARQPRSSQRVNLVLRQG